MISEDKLVFSMEKYAIMGIQIYTSKNAKKCQMCRMHSSRFRRECPICHGRIAPGCRPKKCWSDELNHCRSCHTVVEILKHYGSKRQFGQHSFGHERSENLPEVICYVNLPTGVQIEILTCVCPISDFIWSAFHQHELQTRNIWIWPMLPIHILMIPSPILMFGSDNSVFQYL